MKPFTIKEALSFGWNKTIENFVFLVLLGISLALVSGIFNALSNYAGHGITIYKIVSLVINYFAVFTSVRIGLDIFKNEKPTVKKIFNFDWNMFGYFFLAAVIAMVVYTIGITLFIIPGIFLMVRLGFFSFALVDHNMHSIDSIKRSWKMTKNHFWKLFWFMFVLILINLAGAIAFGVGLLFTVPLCFLATVYVYEKLKAHHPHEV